MFLSDIVKALSAATASSVKRRDGSSHHALLKFSWLDGIFSQVFVSDQIKWLLRSVNSEQRTQISSYMLNLFRSIDANNLQRRCWPYYRSMIVLTLFCAKYDDYNCVHLVRLCHHHSPNAQAFLRLQVQILRDVASQPNPKFTKTLNDIWTQSFFDFAFTQSDWEQILQVFSDKYLYDAFNQLYRGITDMMVRSLIQPRELSSEAMQSYDALNQAIIVSGIYHKGMPRDRYEAFIEHIQSFYQRNMHLQAHFPLQQTYCLKLNYHFQSYISHVLTKSCPEDAAPGDSAVSLHAIDRIVQLWLRLRMIDVVLCNEDDLSSVMLSMRDWQPFPLDDTERFKLLSNQCTSFFNLAPDMIASSGSTMTVKSRFYKAFSVLSVALIQLVCDQLLQSGGSADQLSNFRCHLLFFDAYQTKIHSWVIPELWLDAFEELVEPKIFILNNNLSQQLSHASDVSRTNLLTMMRGFQAHVQRQIGSSLQSLQHSAAIRMSHFATFINRTQTLATHPVATASQEASVQVFSEKTNAGLVFFDDAKQAGADTDLRPLADLSLFQEPRLFASPVSPSMGFDTPPSPILSVASSSLQDQSSVSFLNDSFDTTGFSSSLMVQHSVSPRSQSLICDDNTDASRHSPFSPGFQSVMAGVNHDLSTYHQMSPIAHSVMHDARSTSVQYPLSPRSQSSMCDSNSSSSRHCPFSPGFQSMMDGDPIDSSMNNVQSLGGVRGLGDMHFLTDFSSPLDSGIGEHGAMTTEMQLGQSEYYALSGFPWICLQGLIKNNQCAHFRISSNSQ